MEKLLHVWLVLLVATGLTLESCSPEEEEVPEETIENSDITGDFEGILRNDSLGLGYILYSFELIENSVYTCYYEGTAIGEVTVTGTTFIGEPYSTSNFEELSGSISNDGTSIFFSGTGIEGEGYSFSGDLLAGDRTESHLTIGTTEYSHYEGSSGSGNCDGNIGFTFSMFPSFIPNGDVGASIRMDLDFETTPSMGTYTIVDGIPAGTAVNVQMYYDGMQIQASSGFVAVTGNGTESSISVELDNTEFDTEAFSNDPINPVTVSGTVKCEY